MNLIYDISVWSSISNIFQNFKKIFYMYSLVVSISQWVFYVYHTSQCILSTQLMFHSSVWLLATALEQEHPSFSGFLSLSSLPSLLNCLFFWVIFLHKSHGDLCSPQPMASTLSCYFVFLRSYHFGFLSIWSLTLLPLEWNPQEGRITAGFITSLPVP